MTVGIGSAMKFFALLLSAVICFKATHGNNQNVTIAVVDYTPIQNLNVSQFEMVAMNTLKYQEIIESLKPTKIDMIIFPEDTLLYNPATSVVVEIDENHCDTNKSESLRLLSCAAKQSNAYLIVNLVEKEVNAKSPDGAFFYNTNVIFDRQGKIINKYQKYNLFGESEKKLHKPSTAEEVVISTDFGAKFGIFTCFDIFFKSPAQNLLKHDIDGVIFLTWWFSELPFMTALQTQQMWAHAHNIKFFAAGANEPSKGSGGSGIFSGDQGMILDSISMSGNSETLVYKYVTGDSPDYNPQEPPLPVHVDVLSKKMDDFYLLRDSSVDEFSSLLLDTSNKMFGGSLCYKNGTENELCCHFNLEINVNGTKMADKNSYVYHMVAFTGVRSFNGVYNGGIELCGVIACLNSSLSSCGQRFDNYDDVYWPITFEKIEIKANFEKSEYRTQFPNSLLSTIRPINASLTTWEGKEVAIDGKTMIERSFSLKEPQNRLLTFAIYGRKFDENSPPDDADDDNTSSKPGVIDLLVMLIVAFLPISW